GIPDAKPGIEKVNFRLPASFGHEGSRMLGQNTPAAILYGAPDEEIELAVILRVEDLNVVRAVSADADVVLIGGANWCRAIVGFEHRAALVHVAEAEERELARGAAAVEGCGVGTVEKVNVELAHGVDLIDAAR